MDFCRETPPQRPNLTPTTAPSPVVDLEALGHDQASLFRGHKITFWGAYAPHMLPKKKGAPMEEHADIHTRNQACLFAL